MRLHIMLDEPLVAEIDAAAGRRGRSQFIREAVAREVERRARWAAFERAAGSVPDFDPTMTPESISAKRRSDTRRRERALRNPG